MESTTHDLEQENAALKRQLEEQRFNVVAILEQICHGVNEIRVLLGEKPCSDWLENSPDNWGTSAQQSVPRNRVNS